MSLTETVIEGTIQADGTLVLDERPNLRPGRVTVVFRQEVDLMIFDGDPFWQRMRAMWSIPCNRLADGGTNTLNEVAAMRKEWDEHQQAIELVQRVGQQELPKEPKA